jgi:hypothetical protein
VKQRGIEGLQQWIKEQGVDTSLSFMRWGEFLFEEIGYTGVVEFIGDACEKEEDLHFIGLIYDHLCTIKLMEGVLVKDSPLRKNRKKRSVASNLEAYGRKRTKRQTTEQTQPEEAAGEHEAEEVSQPSTLREVNLPFTPAQIDTSLCLARIWGAGKGGQCGQVPLDGSSFCKRHTPQQVHGLVTGEIPADKLAKFEKAAGTNT